MPSKCRHSILMALYKYAGIITWNCHQLAGGRINNCVPRLAIPVCGPRLFTPSVCPFFSLTFFPFLVIPKKLSFLVTPLVCATSNKTALNPTRLALFHDCTIITALGALTLQRMMVQTKKFPAPSLQLLPQGNTAYHKHHLHLHHAQKSFQLYLPLPVQRRHFNHCS